MKIFSKFVISVAVCEFAGVIGAFFATPSISNWYINLAKPAFMPPAWIFSPVWATLYALMGVSLFLVWQNEWRVKNKILLPKKKAWNKWSERFWIGDLQKENIIAIFVIQLILNISWSYLFFGLQLPVLAFFEILALWWAIFYTIVNFYRVSKFAAWFLLPYVFWVSFAIYLNYSIVVLN
ncbi:MAG: TspO/MBR family protein [Patescibacteria group bacterium]